MLNGPFTWIFMMVGAGGFEPPASCSQSKRATRLRHAPTCFVQKGEILELYLVGKN